MQRRAHSSAGYIQAGRLGGRPATSTPASFVWTRAVSACRAAHDEVSVGNCPHEASTSQGGEGGRRRDGGGRELTEREMTPWAPPILSLSFSLLLSVLLSSFPPSFLWPSFSCSCRKFQLGLGCKEICVCASAAHLCMFLES